MGLELAHGGHLTHGHPLNFSGKYFKVVSYGVHPETEQIDYDRLAESGERASAENDSLRRVQLFPSHRLGPSPVHRRFAVGALLFADIAHYAGLVAAGLYPNPVPLADFVTTTTHKTLRGPRGGVILCKDKYAKDIDRAVFPGVQGGPLMHVIAAKAVAFGEALKPRFKKYQSQVLANARSLAAALTRHGFRIVAGGTDCHLLTIDLRSKSITGKEAESVLGQAGITVNKNTIPFDPEKPFVTSGVRLGTPALTTRGMKEKDMDTVAGWINEAIEFRTDTKRLAKIRKTVLAFTKKFPLYAHRLKRA
jgi:glycine hydroxymethyltransferase